MKGIDIGVESCIACRGFSWPRKKAEKNINGNNIDDHNELVLEVKTQVVA